MSDEYDKTATKFQFEKTERGFGRILFKDRNGDDCSVQDSSLATEPAIWIGVNNASPKILVPGQGWQEVTFPEGTLFHTRMHLTQEMVRQLLPTLIRFAGTGDYLSPVDEKGQLS